MYSFYNVHRLSDLMFHEFCSNGLLCDCFITSISVFAMTTSVYWLNLTINKAQKEALNYMIKYRSNSICII